MINNPCSSRPGTAVARVRQVVDAHEAHCVVILRGLGAPPCPCCLLLRRAVVLQLAGSGCRALCLPASSSVTGSLGF